MNGVGRGAGLVIALALILWAIPFSALAGRGKTRIRDGVEIEVKRDN